MPPIHYCRKCRQHVERKDLDKHDERNIVSFGAILTKPRPEQFRYRQHYATQPKKLPSKVDYRPTLTAGGFQIFDQGQQGSCTANCGCADKAYHEIVQGDYPSPFSRSFLYYEERVILGTTNQDSGAEMENIGQVLGKEGCCLDKTMPYSQWNYTTTPSAAAKSEALNWLDSPTQTRLDLTTIKEALADHGPVRFGIPVPQSFMNTGGNGFVPEPNLNEGILGGHAVLCLGYDDTLTHNGVTGYYLMVNSWGTSWGSQGFFYLSYSTMQSYDSNFGGTDNWQQLDAPAPPPPTPGTLTLTVTPTTLVNDGSTVSQYGINGTAANNSLELDLTDPNGMVLENIGVPSATGTYMTGQVFYTGGYVGPASFTAYDHTANIQSNPVPVTITAPGPTPNPCKIAAVAITALNLIPYWFTSHFPFIRARKGRFYYLNP